MGLRAADKTALRPPLIHGRATMAKASGNGSGKFDIGVHDMGGWGRVTAGSAPATADELAAYLSHRLTAWFREHLNLRLICVLPVNRDGSTVELHSWYEQHGFTDKT